MSNEKLAKKLHNPIIRKFKKRQVYSSFKENIQGADLALEIRFLLCVIDIFGKYARVISLRDKKVIAITNAFQILDESKRKLNKIWVDNGSEIYNRSMKLWLKK